MSLVPINAKYNEILTELIIELGKRESFSEEENIEFIENFISNQENESFSLGLKLESIIERTKEVSYKELLISLSEELII